MPEEPYTIEFTRKAERDLFERRSELSLLVDHIAVLKTDDERGDVMHGPLRKARALKFAVKSGGEMRVLYALDHERRRCIIFLIGSRENLYREAEQRLLDVE